MGKHSNLYEIFFGPIGGFSAYDSLKNGHRGSTHSVGDPLQLDAEFEDESELEDIDEADIGSKIAISKAIVPTDTASRNPQNTSYDNIGYAYPMVSALTEKAVHTNTATVGLTPNLTYRGAKGNKVTKTSFNANSYPKIYNSPRKDMIATQYGTSRSNLPRHNEFDDNVLTLNDMIDKYELSLNRHTKRINKINKIINEINLNFYDS